jgi:Sel1 repeat
MKLKAFISTVALAMMFGSTCGVVWSQIPRSGGSGNGNRWDRGYANSQAQQQAEARAKAERDRAYAQAQAQADELAQEQAAAQAGAKQAAWEAFRDAAVAKLTSERDEAIAKLYAGYTNLADLDSQELRLKQRAVQLESQKNESEFENGHLRAKQMFKPIDPWRLLDGKIYNAKDKSWVQFTGTILEVKPTGILVHGDFGPPLEGGYGNREYFVDNFPVKTHVFADGETITPPMNFVAHLGAESSVYQYTNTTIDLSVHTVRRLDYGKIVDSPPPDLAKQWDNIIIVGGADPRITKELDDNKNELSNIELQLSVITSDFDTKKQSINSDYDAKIKDLPNVYAKQLKEKEAEKQQALAAKVLAFDQAQADKGDPAALLRMGERYRDGKGVEKDSARADEYFKKADEATAAEEKQINEENKRNEQAAKQQKFIRILDCADRGSLECMIKAGKCYRDGGGVEKDLNKARGYFQKASDLGSIEAAQLLNDCK